MSPARLYQDGRVDGLKLAVKALQDLKGKFTFQCDRVEVDACLRVIKEQLADAKAEARLGRTLLKGKS